MRLRNKKTGEICDFKIIADYDDCTSGWRLEKHNGAVLFYDHIDEIHEDWEDYEEPKDFWFVDADGEVRETNYLSDNDKSSLRSFGNYFSSREEAEKAVRKLKAWKRLKNHNLRVERGQRIFVNTDNKLISQKPLFVVDTYEEVEDDLDLILGGEE